MKKKLIDIVQKQANHELFAANSYMAMAYWCNAQEYAGFGKFFMKQAEEEREHADGFFKHLEDRGVMPIISALDEPKAKYKDLVEVTKAALVLEKNNTKGITAAYEAALELKDYAASVMLQEYISEQVEEEAWASSMVAKTERIECSNAYTMLDRHVLKDGGSECCGSGCCS